MNRFSTLAAAALLTFTTAPSLAQQDAEHEAHNHPEGAASQPARAPATRNTAGLPDLAVMDKHMQAMQLMHETMAAAKTPAERETLMAKQMKRMREGMSMIGRMSSAQPAGNPAMRQQMLGKRVDAMQSMMQMMMDRMPKSPPQAGR